MNTLKIFLNKEDYNLLNQEECILVILDKAFVRNFPDNKIEIELTQRQIVAFLDCLSDLLTSRGLGSDSEPNDFGLRIEKLIDLFNSKVIYPRRK